LQAAFRMLVKKQIRKLEEPSIHCVDMVYDELREMLLSCAEKTLGRVPRCRFSKLKTKMIDVAFRLLEERSDEVYAKMQEMVATELVYVNAQHPDFKAKSLLFPPQGAGQPAQFSFGGIDAEDKETRDCRVIKILIESYFGIVKTKIQDSVPKILMLSLVEHVREKLGSALVRDRFLIQLLRQMLFIIFNLTEAFFFLLFGIGKGAHGYALGRDAQSAHRG